MKSDAYYEGYKARQEGKELHDCPYQQMGHGLEALQWAEGMLDCEEALPHQDRR